VLRFIVSLLDRYANRVPRTIDLALAPSHSRNLLDCVKKSMLDFISASLACAAGCAYLRSQRHHALAGDRRCSAELGPCAHEFAPLVEQIERAYAATVLFLIACASGSRRASRLRTEAAAGVRDGELRRAVIGIATPVLGDGSARRVVGESAADGAPFEWRSRLATGSAMRDGRASSGMAVRT
jgi:hypothetical protein